MANVPFTALFGVVLAVTLLVEPGSDPVAAEQDPIILPLPALCLVDGQALISILGERSSGKSGERIAAQGERPNGAGRVALLLDDNRSSWTIAWLRPDGAACVLANGSGWQDVAPMPAEGD